MENESKVAVILFNYNGNTDTCECIKSLLKKHYDAYHFLCSR
jgi:GT2 family glycosyltransferase